MVTPPVIASSPSANKDHLVQKLESITELDGRYQSLQCVNHRSKRGNFSLVFRAYDPIEDIDVAIKFFDPDQLADTYRLNCFRREPEILEKLAGKSRCLRLYTSLNTYMLEFELSSGVPFLVPCDYFICEWLENDIDYFFESQETIEAICKLQFFRDLILSISAIHSANVCHRDIKTDNFRTAFRDAQEIVVAIDFGTSAAFESPPMSSVYSTPVGMLHYAAPEAFLGFAGERAVGKLSDMYSLGCLLFELFNTDSYWFALHHRSNYKLAMIGLGANLSSYSDLDDKRRAWVKNMPVFRPLAKPPEIYGVGSTVPAAIKGILSVLYTSMVEFDYTKREKDLQLVLRKVDSSIKVIENEALYQRRFAQKKALRLKRQLKINEKRERLERYLQSRDIECLT